MLSLAKRAAGALSQPAAQAARLMSTSVAIPNEPDLYMIEQGPSNTAETSKEELMTYLRDMMVVRRMETTADGEYKKKNIRGFCHLYNGQEAISVGMEAAITKKDHIITAYRDHGTYVGRGGSVHALLAELYGRKTGASEGKGGSMHVYHKEHNFYGGNGIVGGQTPLGAGVAFAIKYKGLQEVCFTMYGDGAANQGQLFEAYNLAMLHKLPCIFVCENNHYAMGTSEHRGSATQEYYKRGQYIPGLRVDGMDVLAVREACKWAKDYSLEHGPLVMEMNTYRYVGHSMSDPGTTYRDRTEVSEVRKTRDPIGRVEALLTEQYGVDKATLKALDKEVRAGVKAANEQALADAWPNPEHDFYTHCMKPVADGAGQGFIRGVEIGTSFDDGYRDVKGL